ncbi:hypothetical protein [Mycobacterium sherrisii]|nr:hypothetical protein [Mycobacterium sherrisii]MCV7031672.1 hypothetical protein [Mycobacterium sherrisii]MEC4763748.1 hypothetical protein [Mycobacterium sherrisii]
MTMPTVCITGMADARRTGDGRARRVDRAPAFRGPATLREFCVLWK